MMRDTTKLAEELGLLKRQTDAQRRGYDFQTFVGNLFRAEHFKVETKAGVSSPRQVDLLATRESEIYLVETKWLRRPVDVDAIEQLFTRLEPVPPGVIGVLVSYSGFTQSVIDKVREKAHRPTLLISGLELEQTLLWNEEFLGLLRGKKKQLLTHRRVSLDEFPAHEDRRRKIRVSELPNAKTEFLLPNGERMPWFETSGGFGMFTFAREIPDIDWVRGGGHGVSLDLSLKNQTQEDFIAMIGEMVDMGWVTAKGSWSIQQATKNWHGFGPRTLATALRQWRKRYLNLEIHHTEELCYVDEVDDGFYSITASISADQRRYVWRVELSFQLTGIPLYLESIQHLATELGFTEGLHFRPRDSQSITRVHLPHDDRSLIIEPEALVVNKSDSVLNEEWVVGIVIENPYRRGGNRRNNELPEGVTGYLRESEHIVCSLRSWHSVERDKLEYSLQGFETSWTSDALVVRGIADWNIESDDRDLLLSYEIDPIEK
jgi:restriction endonuclease